MRTYHYIFTFILPLLIIPISGYTNQNPAVNEPDSLEQLAWSKIYSAPDSALYLAQQVLLQAGPEDHKLRGRVGRLVGIAYDVKGQYQDALGSYQSALYSSTHAADSIEIANIWMGKAIIFHRLSDYNRALELYWKAHRVFRRYQRDDRLAAVKNNIGALYNNIELFERAVEMYKELLVLGKKMNDPRRVASSYTNLASSYVGLGQLDSAKASIQRAIAYDKSSKDYYSLASDFQTVGVIFKQEGKLDSALHYFRMCLHPLQGIQIKAKRGAVYPTMAEVYEEKGQRDSALIFLDSAIHHLSAYTKDYEVLSRTYRYKADLLRSSGKSEASNQCYQKALTYMDSNNLRNLESLLIRFEVENSSSSLQDEIIKVKEENVGLTTQQERTFRNFILALIGGGLLIALVIALYIAWSARSKYLKVLDRRNAELQADLRNSERMLSVLAHDFRTPLSGLLMMVDLVQQGDASPEEIKEFGDKAKSNITRTLNGIDELLYWITRDKQVVSKEDVHVFDAVHNAVEIYRIQADNKDAVIDFDRLKGLKVSFDKSHLQIIARNLISNGLKHIPNGGQIEISFTRKEETVNIHFKDNGPGIPATVLSHFRKRSFSKIKSESPNTGVGLGLQLVYELAALNGADVSIESAEGEGTTVHLTIYNQSS